MLTRTRAGLVASALVAALAAVLTGLLTDAPAWTRFVPVLCVLVALPGAALSRHLRVSSLVGTRLASAPVSAAIGVAWLVLSSEVLLYARWWKPPALVLATVCLSALSIAIPVQRGKHGLRWGTTRIWSIGLAMVGTALLLIVQALAIGRSPFRASELTTLQSAWQWSRGSAAPTSSLARLLRWLLPMVRPTLGTLQASRWLLLALLAATLVLAGSWSRSFTRREGTAVTWVLLMVAGLTAHLDDMRPSAGPAGALLLGGGWCLTASRNGSTRRGAAGVLLGIAALGSRTTAVAAVSLVVWSVVDVRRARRPRTGPRGLGASERLVAGFALAAVATVVVARRAGVALPVVSDPVVMAGPLVLLLLLSLLGAAVAIARHHLRERSGPPIALTALSGPAFALAGACAGAAFDGGASLHGLSVLPVLVALCASGLVGHEPTVTAGLPSAPSRRGSSPNRRLHPMHRALVLTSVVLAAGATGRLVEVLRSDNSGQSSRIAYVLERTGPYDAVYDPFGTIATMRPLVNRSGLDQAAFAVVSPTMLQLDPTLDRSIRSTFDPTPYPDVWRAGLRWSTSVAAPN